VENWLDIETAARWASFPVGANPRPVLLLEPRVRMGVGFVDDEAKLAWAQGAIEVDTALPPGLPDLLPERRRGRTHAALTVTDVSRVVAEFRCDRGPCELPAYRMQVTGLRGSALVLSPDVACWWPAETDPPFSAHGDATIEEDGVTIHFPAFGGVLTDFHHAEFQEHDAYVVGRAITYERPAAPGTAVPLAVVDRNVTGRLTGPLGGRVLLTTSGQPLAVLTSEQ
jgi:hypothetical protein